MRWLQPLQQKKKTDGIDSREKQCLIEQLNRHRSSLISDSKSLHMLHSRRRQQPHFDHDENSSNNCNKNTTFRQNNNTDDITVNDLKQSDKEKLFMLIKRLAIVETENQQLLKQHASTATQPLELPQEQSVAIHLDAEPPQYENAVKKAVETIVDSHLNKFQLEFEKKVETRLQEYHSKLQNKQVEEDRTLSEVSVKSTGFHKFMECILNDNGEAVEDNDKYEDKQIQTSPSAVVTTISQTELPMEIVVESKFMQTEEIVNPLVTELSVQTAPLLISEKSTSTDDNSCPVNRNADCQTEPLEISMSIPEYSNADISVLSTVLEYRQLPPRPPPPLVQSKPHVNTNQNGRKLELYLFDNETSMNSSLPEIIDSTVSMISSIDKTLLDSCHEDQAQEDDIDMIVNLLNNRIIT